MRIIVTCGPSFEAIDDVRRITNFSTGELGVLLANRLTRDGHDVTCFKGIGATTPIRCKGKTIAFSTNDHLRESLENFERRGEIGAVFHAAALSDFKVDSVRSEDGRDLCAAKISSREPALMLRLVPAAKLLPHLRELFPRSAIVGWKYEADGTRDAALARARAQMEQHFTAAVVINGPAYGPGFGFCSKADLHDHQPDKSSLCQCLAEWLCTLV